MKMNIKKKVNKVWVRQSIMLVALCHSNLSCAFLFIIIIIIIINNIELYKSDKW